MELTEFLDRLETSTDARVTNSDRERIHLPGSIQPHGVLLVLAEPDLTILRVSANSAEFLGLAPKDLLGQPLGRYVGEDWLQRVRGSLAGNFEHLNPLRLIWQAGDRRHLLNGILHRSNQGWPILELEPGLETIPWVDHPNDDLNLGFFQFYQVTRGTLARLQTSRSLQDLSEVIAHEVRRLTGFDRVMVYRFEDNGDGCVLAEAKADDLLTYNGMYYPAIDIPQQARHLYSLNWLRLIPDIDYQPVPLLSFAALDSGPIGADRPNTSQAPNRSQGQGANPGLPASEGRSGDRLHTCPPAQSLPALADFDMSYCVLRSVSPCHLDYMANMGMAASMSISLLKNKRLWGLVACHHRSPRFLPYEVRTICEFLGQVMSNELSNQEDNDDLDYKLHLKSIESRLIETIAQASDCTAALASQAKDLLALVGATGAALYFEGELTTIGDTPPESEIEGILHWLLDRWQDDLYATDSLSQVYTDLEADRSTASGLLAIAISHHKPKTILWFRPELQQTITWAGNPEERWQEDDQGRRRLLPRNSFLAWEESVKGRSKPWQTCELAGAIALRQAILDILLRRADELAALNRELERSNTELDSFAYIASHDLKEPLRGIHNYSTFLLEDYGNLLDEDGMDKLQTLVRLTERMENLIDSLLHFSRLGRQELLLRPLDLNRLIQEVGEVFKIGSASTGLEISIPEPLPMILGDRVSIEEVFSNLIGNAFKYNDAPVKCVEIGAVALPPNPNPDSSTLQQQTFYVRDNGIGIREKHQEAIFRIFKRLHGPDKYGGGTGAGLTIVKKIIERHGGHIWLESSLGQGSTFFFTLPIPLF